MKKSNLVVACFVLAAIGVIAGSVLVSNKMLTAHSEASAMTCKVTGKTIDVRIQNDVMSPRVITAHRCDTLVIKNLDPVTREIGFGEHDSHKAYDGVTEKVIRQNESFTVTLIQAGSYHFHDHFHDEVEGLFTVY
ncbi:MAG: cupredoxin domain-containing protein [Candidatus Saccharimonadales bacterium]